MAATSPPLTSAGSTATAGGGAWRAFDWPLLLLVLAISIWGCLTVTSATLIRDEAMSGRVMPGSTAGTSLTPDSAQVEAARGARTQTATDESRSGLAKFLRGDAGKQAMWIVIGLLVLILFASVDFQWLMYLQAWLYTINLSLLILVLVIGREVNGAKSWIRFGSFALQPAEFSKFLILVTLAAWLCRRQDKIRELSTIITSLIYIAPIILLILKQPDFGTMLAIFSIWFGMLFFSGARLRHLGLVVGYGLLLFAFSWKAGDWIKPKSPTSTKLPSIAYTIIKAITLKPHQKERLAVFLDPNPSTRSARSAAYQITQSQIAIGAGQITGQGWGRGMQKRGGWVPENNTDFIFTVTAEELGFAGGALLIFLYLALLFRTALIATETENYFGALIAGGFTALIAFHTIINLGMTMRVMPITGVPLPFFSYGGSSYLAFAACVGLLQSVIVRHRKVQSW